jgi:uncharacterized iron-regulated membrane protein
MLSPEIRRLEARGDKLPLATTIAAARAAYPGAVFSVRRGAADEPDEILLRPWVRVAVNPWSGAVIGARDPTRTALGVVERVHGRLLLGAYGHTLVGITGVIVLLEALTGMIRWWRYKTFWITRGANFRRTVFDLHNASGLLALVLVVPLAVTGSMYSWGGPVNRALNKLDRPVAPTAPPADPSRVIGPDDAVRAALAVRPGVFTSLMPPRGERDPWQVSVKTPGDHSPGGRVHVSVDRSGTVVAISDGGPGQLGTRLRTVQAGIHAGWIFGGVGVAIAALGGIALALQAATGFLVWWKPRPRA